jgi:hypothetical protein
MRYVLTVCLVMLLPAANAGAQTETTRGWIDVNIGAAFAGQKDLKTSASIPDGAGESQTYVVGYHSPTGGAFDFGGGYMFTDAIGVGVQFTGTAHKAAADLSISIPHPLFFNSYATDATVTDGQLEHTEGGVNMSLVALLPSHSGLQVKVFGGPTYFRLKADGISEVHYQQAFGFFTRANEVVITQYDTSPVDTTGWGFHAGADLGYFFNRHFGVGGMARFSHGVIKVSDVDVLADGPVDVKVGGLQTGGGLRVRF